MSTKEIRLRLASFLDSPRARALHALTASSAGAGPDAAGVRSIAEAFLQACHAELGEEPRRLDGQQLHTVIAELLPGHFAPRDPLVAHAPAVLEAYVEHLLESEVVAEPFELRQALEPAVAALVATVSAGRNEDRRSGVKTEPFVHGAPKLGRNDPCSCGSGKKFKKCHGKDA